VIQKRLIKQMQKWLSRKALNYIMKTTSFSERKRLRKYWMTKYKKP
jgi:hypothetical protein